MIKANPWARAAVIVIAVLLVGLLLVALGVLQW
jgi:hypothetical protein